MICKSSVFLSFTLPEENSYGGIIKFQRLSEKVQVRRFTLVVGFADDDRFEFIQQALCQVALQPASDRRVLKTMLRLENHMGKKGQECLAAQHVRG